MDKGGIVQMAKLVAFYSRADENYFGGSMKYIQIGNTEKAAKMIADVRSRPFQNRPKDSLCR